jgi:hypothetical protein
MWALYIEDIHYECSRILYFERNVAETLTQTPPLKYVFLRKLSGGCYFQLRHTAVRKRDKAYVS